MLVSFVFRCNFKFCRLRSQSGNTMNSSLNIWKLSIRNWRRITMILTQFSNSLHSAVKFWKLISFSQIFSTNDIYWGIELLIGLVQVRSGMRWKLSNKNNKRRNYYQLFLCATHHSSQRRKTNISEKKNLFVLILYVESDTYEIDRHLTDSLTQIYSRLLKTISPRKMWF